MDAEIIEVPRKCNTGKFHKECPKDLLPLKEKYEVIHKENAAGHLVLERENLVTIRPRKAELIDEADFESMMQRYATDEEVDRLTICEVFGISVTTFDTMVKSEKYAEAWQAVKRARADLLIKRSLQAAYEPYRAMRDGEAIQPHFIKAAQLLSNQCLAIAKVVNPELAQGGGGGGVTAGAIQIQVNTGINIPD